LKVLKARALVDHARLSRRRRPVASDSVDPSDVIDAALADELRIAALSRM